MRGSYRVLLDGVRGRNKEPGCGAFPTGCPRWRTPPMFPSAQINSCGNAISTRMRRIGSFNSPFCMRNSRRCIRFWTMGAWGLVCFYGNMALPNLCSYPEARRESYYEGLLRSVTTNRLVPMRRFSGRKAQGILDLYEKTTRLNVCPRQIFRSADFALPRPDTYMRKVSCGKSHGQR